MTERKNIKEFLEKELASNDMSFSDEQWSDVKSRLDRKYRLRRIAYGSGFVSFFVVVIWFWISLDTREKNKIEIDVDSGSKTELTQTDPTKASGKKEELSPEVFGENETRLASRNKKLREKTMVIRNPIAGEYPVVDNRQEGKVETAEITERHSDKEAKGEEENSNPALSIERTTGNTSVDVSKREVITTVVNSVEADYREGSDSVLSFSNLILPETGEVQPSEIEESIESPFGDRVPRLNLILTSGPNWTSRKLVGDNRNYVERKENGDEQLLTWELGIQASMQLRKHFYFQGGLNYFRISEEQQYNAIADSELNVKPRGIWEYQDRSRWIHTDSMRVPNTLHWIYTDSVYQTRIDSSYQIVNDSSYRIETSPSYTGKMILSVVEFPILINVERSFSNWILGFQFGVSLQYILSRSGKYLLPSGTFVSAEDNKVYRDWNLNGLMGLYADYRLFHRISVGLQPNLRIPFNSAILDGQQRLMYRNFGVRLRIRYYIK